MINIRPHKINIPSKVIEKCWGSYSQKYKEIESNLNASLSTVAKSLQGSMHNAGGFQLPTSKLKLLPDDYLTSYFLSNKANNLVVKLKTKWIFRGADYYVGMQKSSNLQKTELIFSRLTEMLQVLDNVQTTSNLILYLALLDYVRNYSLLLLYAIHQCSQDREVTKEAQMQYFVFLELIDRIEGFYLQVFISAETKQEKYSPRFITSLQFFRNFLCETISTLSINDKMSTDIYRKIREADNPIKTVNFARNISQYYLPRKCVLIGVEYGGIELPFMVNAYRELVGKNKIDILSVNLSSYSIASKRYVDEIGDSLSPFASQKTLEKYDTALILEDSITTGRTIEYLCGLLPENIKQIYFRCISFTNTNRYHHLTRFEHGGVNPIILEKSTALYPSTYTKTYAREKYTNKSGVFNKEKNRIMKMQKSYYPELIN